MSKKIGIWIHRLFLLFIICEVCLNLSYNMIAMYDSYKITHAYRTGAWMMLLILVLRKVDLRRVSIYIVAAAYSGFAVWFGIVNGEMYGPDFKMAIIAKLIYIGFVLLNVEDLIATRKIAKWNWKNWPLIVLFLVSFTLMLILKPGTIAREIIPIMFLYLTPMTEKTWEEVVEMFLAGTYIVFAWLMTKSLIAFPYEGERYAGLFINVASAGIISGLALTSVMIYFIYMLKKGDKNIWKYVACVVLAVYPMYGLYITENRTGMMGPVMVLVFWWLFLPKKRSWKVYAVRWGLLVGAVVVGLLLGYRLYKWVTMFEDKGLISREVRIINSFQIIKQPEVCIEENEEVAVVCIEAIGVVRYQWQYGDGELWKECVENDNWTGCQSDRLVVQINEDTIGYQYRCAIFDKMDNFMCSGGCLLVNGNISAKHDMKKGKTSTLAAVGKSERTSAEEFAIMVEPEDVTATMGEKVEFRVVVPGNNVYRWQYFDGKDWNNLINNDIWLGAWTDSLQFEADITNMEYKYRCYVKKTAGEQINEFFYPYTNGKDRHFVERFRLANRFNNEERFKIIPLNTYLNFLDIMSSSRISVYIAALRNSSLWGKNEIEIWISETKVYNDPHNTFIYFILLYGQLSGEMYVAWMLMYSLFSAIRREIHPIMLMVVLWTGGCVGVSLTESTIWSEVAMYVLLVLQYALITGTLKDK